jgi:hypothetical protein
MARRTRASSPAARATRSAWSPYLVPQPRRVKRHAADTGDQLAARVERVRRALYDLYSELEYFIGSSTEHRAQLRETISWPDVGHITSLARALSEEDRFTEWARFNRYVKVA